MYQLTSRGRFKAVAVLWIFVCIFSWWINYSQDRINNYRIFIGVFHHLVDRTNLYAEYPQEYGDTNHYGPIFALFISPFAKLPIGLGSLIWVLLNAGLLIYAVWLLPLLSKQKWLILLFSTLEFANTTHSSQSNCLITALIIFSYILVEKGKDEWATCLLVLGAFMKIYPIVAFVFFVFSKRKSTFLLSSIFWAVIFFVGPMFISGKNFVLQSYMDWYNSLVIKIASNREIGAPNNFSIIGVIDGCLKKTSTSNALVILIGLSILCLPLIRFSQYSSQRFKLFYLSSVLLFVVLFSSSSENPTYIIAVIGACLWFVQLPDLYMRRFLFPFIILLLFTALISTEVVPSYVKDHFIYVYAVKAWPSIIVWSILSYQLIRCQFKKVQISCL